MRCAIAAFIIGGCLAVCEPSGATTASWTLWTKTEMSTLAPDPEAGPLFTHWSVAGRSKESSTFESKAMCESARERTLEKFRGAQGTRRLRDYNFTIKVADDAIFMISIYDNGQGNSEQKVHLFCLDKEPEGKIMPPLAP